MGRSMGSMSTDGVGDDFRDEADQDDDQIDIQHYIRILRKNKFPIVLFTALITGLAAYYAYTATPVYKATTTLLIESQANSSISFEELVGVETENQDYYGTQFELLKSRGLAKRVVDVLNLWDDPELSPSAQAAAAAGKLTNSVSVDFLDKVRSLSGVENSGTGVTLDLDNPEAGVTSVEGSELAESAQSVIDRFDSSSTEVPEISLELSEDTFGDQIQLTQSQQIVLSAFMNRLSVEPVRKTKLVKISYESYDPDRAAKVANTVSEQYIDSYLDAKMELTTRASSWLNERLSQLKLVLDQSEEALIEFKQANGLVDVGGSVGRLNEQELLLATAELAQARSDLSNKADVYRDVQSLKDQPQLLESIPAFQADPLVQRVKIDQGQAQRQLDELRNRYGDRHPRVVDAKSQLATLNLELEGHISRVVGSIAKDYQLSQQRVSSIESKLNLGKNEIQAIGTKKFELDALEREVATNRSIYDTFFSRITEAKSADGLEAANARIADYAQAPVTPFKPKKQLIIALAALASLILSVLMAFLYEQMDDTVSSTRDVEQKLGQSMLGLFPLIKVGGAFGRNTILPLNPLDITDKNGTFIESVNTARTVLCMSPVGKDAKVITITSSIPGEGKSTTSLNLAFSLSRLERTLLIDCDLRRPTIGKAIDRTKENPGISNLIAGTAKAKDVIVRNAIGNMDIISSGSIVDQPLELLSSARFAKILEQLSKYYDRIVLDSAPTQSVSDALILAQLSDAVVYVVKSHDTAYTIAQRGLERLKQVNAPIAGVIVTQVDMDKISSYGGDYYYQGYYDYYGYGNKPTSLAGSTHGDQTKIRLNQSELDNLNQTADYEIGMEDMFGDNNRTRSTATPNSEFIDNFDDLDATTRLAANPEELEVNKRGRHFKSDDLDII